MSSNEDPLYLLPQGRRPSTELEERCRKKRTNNLKTKSTQNAISLPPQLLNMNGLILINDATIVRMISGQCGKYPQGTVKLFVNMKCSEDMKPCVYFWCSLDRSSRIMVNSNFSPKLALLPSKSSATGMLDSDYQQCKSLSHCQTKAPCKYQRLQDWKPTEEQSTFDTIMFSLWHAREWDQILSLLAAAANDSSPELVLSSLSNLTRTLQERQTTLDLVQKDAYKFLAGISAFSQGLITQGHALISHPLFGRLPQPMRDEALSILATMVSKHPPSLSVNSELKATSLKSIINSTEFQDPNSKLSLLIPKPKELDPPVQVSSMLTEIFLTSEHYNCYILEREEKILEKARNHSVGEEEIGNLYLDLMQICHKYKLEDRMRSKAHALTQNEIKVLNEDLSKFGLDLDSMKAECLLLGALWFLKKLQKVAKRKRAPSKATCGTNEAITLAQKIHQCLSDLFSMAQSKHMHPGMKLYVYRMCAGAKLATIQCTKGDVTENDVNFFSRLLQTLEEICCFTPFWSVPPISVYEAGLLNYYLGKLQSAFVLHLQNVPPEKCVVKQKQLSHQLFENHFKSLCPINHPDRALFEASEAALREKGLTVNDVAKLLFSPLTPCDKDGWAAHLSEGRHESMQYTTITGISLDSNAESVYIECRRCDPGKGILSENDICLSTVALCNMDNPMSLTCSLDPIEVERYSLFQKFVIDPPELDGTPIEQVMLECDYLLKQLTTGSEISCKPPFRQRPCSEGLTKDLPPHLRKGLTMSSRGGRFNSHRYWIKAEEIRYRSSSPERVKDIEVKMVVHHHPQKVCAEGRLCDTEYDDPNSAESKFVSFFTDHYDELATYFPVLARLKELCKLQLLAKIVMEKLPKIGQKQKKHIMQLQSTKYVPSTFFQGRRHCCTGGVVLKPKLDTLPPRQARPFVCGKCCSTAPTSREKIILKSIWTDDKESLQRAHQDQSKMPTNRLKDNDQLSSVQNIEQLLSQNGKTSRIKLDPTKESCVATEGIEALQDGKTSRIKLDPTKESCVATEGTEQLNSHAEDTPRSFDHRGYFLSESSSPAGHKFSKQHTPTGNSTVSSPPTSRPLGDQSNHVHLHNARVRAPQFLATQSEEQILANSSGKASKNHRVKADFKATQSVEESSFFRGRTCMYCSCPEMPTSSKAAEYPKGVKLAPMIREVQSSPSFQDQRQFGPCICVKLGSNAPTMEELQSLQPVQVPAWDTTDYVFSSRNVLQPLKSMDKESPAFKISCDKWVHIFN